MAQYFKAKQVTW